MNRQEHLQWCKDRALEYCDDNDPQNAMASMLSDMRKHEETKSHIALELGMMMMMGGLLKTVSETRKFIEGFN